MQKEQTKNLIVNILTVVIVMGVFIAGYFVFIKRDVSVVGSNAPASVSEVAKIAEETAIISTEIDSAVRDLEDLANAVDSSNIIFNLPSFRSLQDFSVSIPEESTGRVNPFILPEWKLRLEALVVGQ